MIRLRAPGGTFTSEQLAKAADLADTYAQGELCITTRQTLQFHWVRKEDIHKILEGMQETGMNSRNACGDVTRNVVTCSLQGVCPHEIGDTRKMLDAIADDEVLLFEQRNLPRKHKISVAGCGRACAQTLMNCQGWVPAQRFDEKGEVVGWKFHAGGGLGARPYMAKLIFDWVPENLVVDVTRAATEVFRRKGNRRIRGFARLKMIVDRMGARGFGEEVLKILQEWGIDGTDEIEPATGPAQVDALFLNGQAVVPQKQEGFNTIRVMILRSELTTKDARQFAEWAEAYGNGEVMLTNRQNLELRFIPDAKVEELLTMIHEVGYRTEGHERLPDMVACVGTTQCNLAVSDTPMTYKKLYSELASDEAFWKDVGQLRINMNGCPNSCAQHWIADIGLRGTRKREETGSDEGFDIFVGGGLNDGGHIGQHVCQVTGGDVVPVLRRILEDYIEDREDGENVWGICSAGDRCRDCREAWGD